MNGRISPGTVLLLEIVCGIARSRRLDAAALISARRATEAVTQPNHTAAAVRTGGSIEIADLIATAFLGADKTRQGVAVVLRKLGRKDSIPIAEVVHLLSPFDLVAIIGAQVQYCTFVPLSSEKTQATTNFITSCSITKVYQNSQRGPKKKKHPRRLAGMLVEVRFWKSLSWSVQTRLCKLPKL